MLRPRLKDLRGDVAFTADEATERGVPSILYGVVSPSGYHFGNFGEAVAMKPLREDD
jgi:hypothetical protein